MERNTISITAKTIDDSDDYLIDLSRKYPIMRREHRENRHHLIGKSLKDEYNVHEECNKIKMDEHRHNALHALFGLLLTPKEQLKELNCLYDTILSETAKQLFLELINLKDSEFYDPKLLKKKSFRNNQ